MNEIRVLQLMTTLVSGGVQRVVLGYAKQVKRYGVTFDYLVQGAGNAAIEENVRSDGSKIFTIPPVNGNPFVFFRFLYRFLKDHPEYRILHVHQNYLNWLPLLTARLAGVKVRISHSHSNRVAKSFSVKIARAVLRTVISRSATDLWACSETAYQWLYRGRRKNKFILYNAVDDAAFAFSSRTREQTRAALGAADRFFCVCVGSLSQIKNQKFLLDVFDRLKASDTYQLFLVGDGDQRDALAREIASRGLTDTVRLLGDRSDVPDLLSAADCFLLPSLTEGLPLSVIEAQVNGLPCIVSSAVTREVKITQNVFFAPVGAENAAIWAEKIAFLRENAFDRAAIGMDEIAASGYALSFEAPKLSKRYKELAGR